MKKITLLSLFFLGLVSTEAQVKKEKHFGKEFSAEKISPTGHIRCATDEYEASLQSKDPKRMNREKFENYLAPFIEQYKNKGVIDVASESGGIIYIPVVVHVIHNGDAYGVNENITDEQVESQITVMNQDFRRMLGTPGYNTNPVGADIQIEFVLAKVDPNGNPTNGINRLNLCTATYAGADANATIANVEAIKPSTIWNPTQYMNMWSVNWEGSGLLGYAQFPSSGTATANTDGVVSGHTYFGSRTLAPGGTYADTTYDKGRTMTHEVGHFLGLYHTFQGGCAGENNTSGDFCADTPAVGAPNYGCTPTNSCPSGASDMIENYMDYTDDSCMNIFTAEQKARIVAVMNSFPRRSTLKTSTKDLPITLFANDAEIQIENYCAGGGNPCTGNLHKILLYNRGTSNLTSADINYNVNGGSNSTHNWTGNLAPNKYAMVSLTTTETTGTLNVSVAATNGVTDQRAGNNNASKAFSFSPITPPTDYAYTNFTFDLIGDPWGNETTWDLRNSSDVIVYSGGPYTFTGVAGTQVLESGMNWTLPADCYTFTIYDGYGDGMGGSGAGDEGSWTIRTNSGAITVGTGGGNFGTSESVSFSNASLSASEFGLNSISIYPNPTKDVLNISIPTELGTNVSYEVYNYLGQNVMKSTSSNSNFMVNTSNFSTGVYFIKLQTESGAKTFRFIKN